MRAARTSTCTGWRPRRRPLRQLFLGYMARAEALRRAPFYNTLTSNCTTIVFDLARQIVPGLPLDYRLLLSGYFAEYAYDRGGLAPASITPPCTRWAISMRARCRPMRIALPFSQAIRRGVPGIAPAGAVRGAAMTFGGAGCAVPAGAVSCWCCWWPPPLLDGCAMVEVKSVSASQFIAQKRGDILTRGRLSDASEETLRVARLEQGRAANRRPLASTHWRAPPSSATNAARRPCRSCGCSRP